MCTDCTHCWMCLGAKPKNNSLFSSYFGILIWCHPFCCCNAVLLLVRVQNARMHLWKADFSPSRPAKLNLWLQRAPGLPAWDPQHPPLAVLPRFGEKSSPGHTPVGAHSQRLPHAQVTMLWRNWTTDIGKRESRNRAQGHTLFLPLPQASTPSQPTPSHHTPSPSHHIPSYPIQPHPHPITSHPTPSHSHPTSAHSFPGSAPCLWKTVTK